MTKSFSAEEERILLLVPGITVACAFLSPVLVALIRPLLPLEFWLVQILLALFPQLVFCAGIVATLCLLPTPARAHLKRLFDPIWLKTFKPVFFLAVCLGGVFIVGGTHLIIKVLTELSDSSLPPTSDQALLTNGDPTLLIGVGISAILVAPWAEEILFRGLLYDGIASRFTRYNPLRTPSEVTAFPWLAVFFTAFFFAVIHQDVAKAVPLFIFALYLQWTRWYFKSLWAPVLVHFFNNLLSVLVFAARYLKGGTSESSTVETAICYLFGL